MIMFGADGIKSAWCDRNAQLSRTFSYRLVKSYGFCGLFNARVVRYMRETRAGVQRRALEVSIMPKVAVVMGSHKDFSAVEPCIKQLAALGIEVELSLIHI